MAHFLVECAVRATLVATVTGVILWAARIRTPVVLHGAWTGVLLSMLLLPVSTMWGPRVSMRVMAPMPAPPGILTTPPAAVFEAPQMDQRSLDTVESSTAQAQGLDWPRVWLGLYLLVASALLARLAIGTVRTQRLIRGAVRRDGRLIGSWCAAPITVGWFRPVAILPEHSHEWPPAQLAAVLTHELEHARRRDPLVQWLALLNRAIFWFHPLA
jgi:BlaR1 peptidase M56